MNGLEFNGLDALIELQKYTNSKNRLNTDAVDLEFEYPGFSVKYDFAPEVTFEVRYNERERMNYLEVEITLSDTSKFIELDRCNKISMIANINRFENVILKGLTFLYIEDDDINYTTVATFIVNDVSIFFDTKGASILKK